MQDLEFHRRGRAIFCYVASIVLTLIGIALTIVAIVVLTQPGEWKEKSQFALEWLIAATPLLLSARKLWLLAKSYRHSFVRLDANGVTIHTTGGKHFEIPYPTIRSATWQPPAKERGLLIIDTVETHYHFDSHACPKPEEIARRINEKIATNL